MEKAVVSTTIGAEGLPVRDGTELLLADEADAFAASVVRVLMDDDFARALGAQAAATVREKFGWTNVAARFADLCEQAVVRHKGAREAGEALPEAQRAVG